MFGASDEPIDNLLVSGRILYEIGINAGDFHLPVMGNISTMRTTTETDDPEKEFNAKISEILNSTQGANVGLFPYYELVNNATFTFTVHGGASWQLNTFKNESSELAYLHQFRGSIGVDFTHGKSDDGKHPLLLSISPAITAFDGNVYEEVFGEKKSSLSSLEIAGSGLNEIGFGLLLYAQNF